jgi:uncharacterized protein (TIGR00299 family) protein
MVIVIDPQIAGISGDMLLCSLVHIGADKEKIINGIKTAEKFLDGSTISKIDFGKVKKHGTEATELILEFTEDVHERKGSEIKKCILNSIEKIGLSKQAKDFAISSIDSLIQAESKIHGEPTNSIHFHEASSIDTIVDIIGTAIALDDLNFFDDKIITTPVAVGGGTVTFSHGTTSNPAGAILEIFKNSGITLAGGQADQELTTPTGASMLISLTKHCSAVYPTMKIQSIGYGAGKKDFEQFSNVLKIIQGEKSIDYIYDTVKILETNVDDISGEVLGNMIEKIMAKGAKDVTVSSAITKKGRPTHLVSVICDSITVSPLLDLLISETGTLGVRIRTSDRITVPRSINTINLELEGEKFVVNYKSKDENSYDFKIESEDIKSVSESIKKPFRETEELLRTQIKKQLELQ